MAKKTAKKIKYGKFVDKRDGKTYKTVKIGNQTWMAENLNFECEGSESYQAVVFAPDDPWGYRPDEIREDESFYEKYGCLYDWETAAKACPEGWHLPTDEEWHELAKHADKSLANKKTPCDSDIAGKHLKAGKGWETKVLRNRRVDKTGREIIGRMVTYEGNEALDTYGFAALPSGACIDGYLRANGIIGQWWTSTETAKNGVFARTRGINIDHDWLTRFKFRKTSCLPVRLVKD